jgi:hypothetical protein
VLAAQRYSWASALDNGNVIPKPRDASWLQDQEHVS